jgi:hypothetical protein
MSVFEVLVDFVLVRESARFELNSLIILVICVFLWMDFSTCARSMFF